MATTIENAQAKGFFSTSAMNSITVGTVSGLVGGSVFGVQMAAMGMLPMVASMIGSESPLIGFVLHMLISAVIGAAYGFIAPRLPQGLTAAAVIGIVYGVIWWVLGALVIMPIIMGMGEMVLQVGDPQVMSLIGHIFFGIVLTSFYALATRSS